MIIFLSNYYNHHQAPFCEEMYRLTNGEFRFIQTEEMEEERVKLGWGEETGDFVIHYSKHPQNCKELVDKAEVVIYGSAPYHLIKGRLKAKKLTFIYTERLYKKKAPWWKKPKHAAICFLKYGRYKNVYLLCAGAYTAIDFNQLGLFKKKAYKWGYFPRTERYNDVEWLLREKTPASILWVGRFIDVKHPEIPVRVAKALKADGYDFQLNMIGCGELEEVIKQSVTDNGLEEQVHLLGVVKHTEVREYMKKSKIFIFSSDRNEGWGAVLNEAMNSGCALVANHVIGSVPFMIEHEKNGIIYPDGDFRFLYESVKKLLDNPQVCEEYGRAAYKTVTESWGAERASKNLLSLISSLEGEEKIFIESGPCSKAEKLKENWFKG